MELARRHSKNPLLTKQAISPTRTDFEVACLFNPGVFRFQNKTWLIARVGERPIPETGKIKTPIINSTTNEIEICSFDETDPLLNITDPRVFTYDNNFYLTTLSHFRLLCSDDGVNFVEDKNFPPLTGEGLYETFGIEDCRVTQIGDMYYLTFTSVAPIGVTVSMRTTKNWKTFEKCGLILPPHNKDCTLFDQKINNKFFVLHRPSSVDIGGNYIWIAESPDGMHWGNHKCIATTRRGEWDAARIGAGASPILTHKGWLCIYHGADFEHRYCLGALLLDKNDPSKVIARSKNPIMEPTTTYETEGFFGKVVFTNGHVVNGDRITIYYGSADEIICTADFSIQEILKTLLS